MIMLSTIAATLPTHPSQAFALRRLASAACLLVISACGGGNSSETQAPAAFQTRALLGEALFADTNLSLNRTQSCSTCHNPEHAFIDSRVGPDGQVVAVSAGDGGISLGDRNTPTAAYASLIPVFQQGSHARFNSQQPDYQGYIGGQFLDGRTPDLAAQAGGPPLNPVEMAMPDKASVVARLEENQDYVASFKSLFGDDVFDDVEVAYAAMTESIAEFETGDDFAPFESKYDLFLEGEYIYDPLSKAALGKSLFFSQQFTNCATCHQLKANSSDGETFTNYEYHNIGVPINTTARQLNGKPNDFVDNGLLDNDAVSDDSETGKFKVPTLRNVAVTAPYMHNGVFKELKTVIEFYDHYLTDSQHTLNPETGAPWEDPEITDNLALTELEDGAKMTTQEVEAMVCFLRTLTDRRFEHLIPEEAGIACD